MAQFFFTSSRTRGGVTGIVIVVMLFLAAVGVAVWRLSSGDKAGGAFVQADFEREVARQIARVAQGTRQPEAELRVAILRLFRQQQGAYVDGLETLTRTLADAECAVKVYDSRLAKIGHNDDYTAGIDPIVADFDPHVIVILVHGGFETARVTSGMTDFVEKNGRLIFVGRIYRSASPILDLIRAGKAVAVLSNSGPLAKLAPESRALDADSPEDYFRKYRTVLTSKNADAILGPGK